MASVVAAGATSGLLVVPAAASACPPAALSKSSKKSTGTTGPCHHGRSTRRSVSCRATGGREDDGLLWLPRRDVLAGLTGVASGLAGYPGLASAALEAQLEETCKKGDKVSDKLLSCTDRGQPCPPVSSKVVDFTPASSVTRVRQPAHLLEKKLVEDGIKYKEAVAKMKALPDSNPLSFTSQAAIHEAYCDSHYRYDPTEKNRPFDVHFSWIFAPWHRMYIYFYERALGQLIGDDTFALPYWNWDAPAGMGLPAIFKDPNSSLFDANRNQANLNGLVDLDYLSNRRPVIPFEDKLTVPPYTDAVNVNLFVIYNQMIRSGKGSRCFLGDKLCSATASQIKEINERSKGRQDSSKKLKRGNTSGALERMAHTTVHVWTGKSSADANVGTCTIGHDGKQKCNNDMGFLGAAGRDPVFYTHHSNVDRMWYLWSTKLGGKGFDDAEWLDTSFAFYDDVENPRLVRMKVRDVLDTRNLGYTYDKESEKDLPWMSMKTKPLVPRPMAASTAKKASPVYPLPLATANKVVEVPGVAKPAKDGSKLQVLVIEGIEFDPTKATKFDVGINLPLDVAASLGPQHSEYAGTFSAVASSSDTGSDGTLEGKVKLVLDDVLADIGAGSDSTVDVVLVPRSGDVKINLPLRILNEEFC